MSFRIRGPQKMASLRGRRRPRECGVELSPGRACVAHMAPRGSKSFLGQAAEGPELRAQTAERGAGKRHIVLLSEALSSAASE
ncbi:hypothetical protein ATY81_12905 [Rhizobium sp. R72]|nr:hypothetical protein ATY81_12905 [Rhizobium sp. R72]OWV94600.1 hypothetical protein ATY80_12905 [Rhizobium sp. R711]